MKIGYLKYAEYYTKNRSSLCYSYQNSFFLVYAISVGCFIAISRSETLLYIDTSYYVGVGRNYERAVGYQTENDEDDDDYDDNDNAAALWSLPPFQIIKVCQEGLNSVNKTVRGTDKTETKTAESKSCRPREDSAFAEEKVEIWELRDENGKQSSDPAEQRASIGDEKRKDIGKWETVTAVSRKTPLSERFYVAAKVNDDTIPILIDTDKILDIRSDTVATYSVQQPQGPRMGRRK